jgi:GDP-4-dehydro-6-deoxy-D-mannose reductase
VTPTVLITGASGFAGSHLLEYLAGSHDLVAWSRSSPVLAELRGKARWQTVNLLDRDSVRAAVGNVRPRFVYHCAGLPNVQGSWTDPALPLAHNVLGTHHLLDALRRTRSDGGCRVLVTGSAAVYAPSPSPLHEGSGIHPQSPYALSKLAQEMLGRRAVSEDGLEVIVTRSFNHTGPRQSPAFMASGFARQFVRIERGDSEAILRVGNVDAQRDLSDVRDVVSAYVALMERGIAGEVYNVASGVARSARWVIDTLAGLAGTPVRLEVDAERLRPFDAPILVGDASKLRGATGWIPQIPIERTLADLLDYWRTVPTLEK